MGYKYTDPRPGGKKVLNKNQLALFEELVSIGCSLEDVALEVSALEGDSVTKRTLHRRMLDDNEEIKEIYDVARAKYKNSIARRINQKTHDDEVAGNTSLLIFTAKTQLRWKEPKEVEDTGKKFSIIVRQEPLGVDN